MAHHTLKYRKPITTVLASFVVLGGLLTGQAVQASPLPDPVTNVPLSSAPGAQTLVLSGGCFWGVQAVFQHVKGVKTVVSGYAGGAADTAHYETVSQGTTGHAESVKITYDPSVVTLGQLYKVYFEVAQDPTELNRQGPDTGTQYRSTIFYADTEQKHVAEDYIAQLQQAHSFSGPIMTTLEPLKSFYDAEAHHQNYAKLDPYDPYILINDAPKVSHLKKELPDLYVD